MRPSAEASFEKTRRGIFRNMTFRLAARGMRAWRISNPSACRACALYYRNVIFEAKMYGATLRKHNAAAVIVALSLVIKKCHSTWHVAAAVGIKCIYLRAAWPSRECMRSGEAGGQKSPASAAAHVSWQNVAAAVASTAWRARPA